MCLHSEELSKQRTRVTIAYEYDSEQAGKLRCALDQMKATVATKDKQIKQLKQEHEEQIKKLLQERDDALMKYKVHTVSLFVALTLNYCICSDWLCFLLRNIEKQT